MLRVGVVHYLNAWPLAWSFLGRERPEGVEPLFLAPSEVAEEMAAGRLDVGLLPSAELARIPDLRIVPGLCIAAESEARSVLLVSRVDPARIRRLALDESSRTSAVLVRILLAERWGAHPECVSARPELDVMLEQAQAALIIGDPALAVDRRRYQVIDLAAAWRTLTGLPFVFAVWAVAPGVEAEGLCELFLDSLASGEREHGEIVARAVDELGLDAEEVDRYLTRHLSFRLAAAESRSLGAFFELGHRHHLLPPAPSLRFIPVAPAEHRSRVSV